MKNVILTIVCLFAFQIVVVGQEVVQTDIIITPKTVHHFGFSGILGGKGAFFSENELGQPDWLSWSIGNNVPFKKALPSGDIVFSTCVGDFADANDWHERMRISKEGDTITLKNGIGLVLTSPNGKKTLKIFMTDSGTLVFLRTHYAFDGTITSTKILSK